MSPEQEQHLEYILTEAIIRTREKYSKGAVEHSGDLLDLTELELVENALDECIDQLTYLLSLYRKLKNE